MKKTRRRAARGSLLRTCSQLGKAALALTAILCLALGAKITTKAEGLDVSYLKETTDFDVLLEENAQMKMVFDTFSSVYFDDGERVYKDEFIVGIMANIAYEGDTGVVEYAFSRQHQYGFRLPSGGSVVKTAKDAEYLMAWGTCNSGSKKGCASKGSLGVSSLQWSYGRRNEWLSILLGIFEEKEIDHVSEEELLLADARMFLYELDPFYKDSHDEDFYGKVVKMAEKHGGDAESYAEAICDFYVLPKKACLSMNESGDACKERRSYAGKLWGVFSSKEKKTVEVVVSSVVNKQ